MGDLWRRYQHQQARIREAARGLQAKAGARLSSEIGRSPEIGSPYHIERAKRGFDQETSRFGLQAAALQRKASRNYINDARRAHGIQPITDRLFFL